MARQNLLFTYFTCTLSAEIRAAKAEGRYFEGVSDLGGSHVSKVEPEVSRTGGKSCICALVNVLFLRPLTMNVNYLPLTPNVAGNPEKVWHEGLLPVRLCLLARASLEMRCCFFSLPFVSQEE